MAHVQKKLRVSQRRACRVLGQSRSSQSSQRVEPPQRKGLLRAQIVALAAAYGRYGYRKVTGRLRWERWRVNPKRVARIWREEGLKLPSKQPKRKRLWLGDGSCIRLRPHSSLRYRLPAPEARMLIPNLRKVA